MFNSVFGGSTINQAKPTLLQLNPLSASVTLSWPVIAAPSANVVADLIEATPSAPGFIITMPDARVGSTGVATIFNNLSNANSFIVQDNLGNTILTAAFGTTWLLYLADNSTQQGTWHAFQYGSNSGSINIAAIAGAGLIAQSGSLSQNLPVTTQSTNYVSVAGDRAKMFVWTGGAGTFTLPTAAVAGSGWYLQIKNSGGGDLTVSPPAGTIDGSASKIFHSATVDSATVFTDGTNYFTMGFGAGSAASSFGYITVAVGGNTDVTLAGGQLNQISYKLTGVLTGSINLIVPASVQQYWINNATTGAFTITVKTGAGTGLQVGQGTSTILYCDGTNVVAGQTGAAFPIAIAQGGTSATTAGAALTNLGGTGVGTGVFTASTTNLALIALGIANAAGNWTIAAPASGVALTVTGIAGSSIAAFNSATAAVDYVEFQRNAGAFARIGNGSALTGSSADFAAFWGLAGDGLSLGANATEYLRIASAGNVTINAPSSGTALDITGVAAGNFLNLHDGTVTGQIGSGGGRLQIGTSNATQLDLYTNGLTKLSIAPAGNVTINAPSSGTALTVNGLSGASTLTLSSTGAASTLITGWATVFAGTWDIVTQSTDGLAVGTAGATTLQLITNSLSRITASSAGNVTINAPTSGVPLTIVGGAVGGNNVLTMTSSAANQAAVGFAQSGQTAFIIYNPASSNDLRFFSGADRVVFSTAGTVTINAPTATNPALTINGSAATPGINIGNSGTSIVQDITRSNVYRVLMTGNVTTFTLQNPQDGQTVNIFLTQDGTGTRTMGGAAGWTVMKWAGGIAGVLSTAINTVDLLVATYRSDTAVWYATLTKAFS